MARQSTRYGAVAMSLHWLIAALIVTNYVLAWRFDDLHGPAKLAAIQPHKAIGILILLLTVLRLLWRLMNKPPAMSAHLKPWERNLAHAVHGLFYVFMIGMPLTGWAMVSASTRIKVFPISMFGLFNWPAIGPLANLPHEQMHAAHEALETAHVAVFAWMGYGLLALHVLGALKHQFLDNDNELARMIPFLGAPKAKDAVA